MEVKDSWLVILRRRMPSDQYGAIGNRELDFLDAIQARRLRRDSCWIGEIHEEAIAEIGCRANCGIDRDEPYNERHNIMLHPALSQR